MQRTTYHWHKQRNAPRACSIIRSPDVLILLHQTENTGKHGQDFLCGPSSTHMWHFLLIWYHPRDNADPWGSNSKSPDWIALIEPGWAISLLENCTADPKHRMPHKQATKGACRYLLSVRPNVMQTLLTYIAQQTVHDCLFHSSYCAQNLEHIFCCTHEFM
jgi:hypothetical protein